MTFIAKTFAAGAAIAALLGGAARAEPESQLLFQKDQWTVEVVYDAESGNAWCVAATDNGRGQQFEVTLFDPGQLALYVWDQSWGLDKRSVDFLLDIDGSRWHLRGLAEGQSVSLGLNGKKEAVQLLDELYAGKRVRVYSAGGTRLASFSLGGSAASLKALFDCGVKIGAFTRAPAEVPTTADPGVSPGTSPGASPDASPVAPSQ